MAWYASIGKKQKWLLASTAVAVVGLILTGYGVWGLGQRYSATHQPTPPISTETIVSSIDEPEETPPACNDSYHVPANEPRSIEIPSIGVAGCIQKVGVDQYNAIATPANIHVAGWYTGSPVPGDKGVSVIDGHVFGRHSDAIFTMLKSVQAGSIIRIEYGDRSSKEFRVIDKTSRPLSGVIEHLFEPLPEVESQLNLITCGGVYDQKAQTYDERVIVRAELQPYTPRISQRKA